MVKTDTKTAAQIKTQAQALHAQYPQYKGHWDNYRLVRVNRRIKTKAGVAFIKGEVSIGIERTNDSIRELDGCVVVYSCSNNMDTVLSAHKVTFLE